MGHPRAKINVEQTVYRPKGPRGGKTLASRQACLPPHGPKPVPRLSAPLGMALLLVYECKLCDDHYVVLDVITFSFVLNLANLYSSDCMPRTS